MDAAISEDVAPLIKDSIRREIILLESKINLAESEIKQFEDKYHLASSEFLKKFEKGDLGDSQDYFEWWGLIKGLKKLEERLKKSARG
ncbi:MAG: hypothetical protein OIN88_13985 [Candidatus Methanoperedens sp.]|nr:hypothetical protein [Candidatus Methanoperedens sp.]MCZ7360729.1 hypothetical protein [Candidatus Methanoperedens sp.]